MNTLKELLLSYKLEHKAIPAFNIDSFEIFQAVEMAVKETNLPCIVQLSPNEDDFVDARSLFLLARKANLEGLPIYLNMDHGKDLNRLQEMVRLGFDMIHFDGSAMTYDQNLSSTTPFVKEVRTLNQNTLVEVEFNQIGSTQFTDPSVAIDFVNQTNADLLAVSIGNTHGVDTNNPEKIDLDLLKTISDNLPQTLLTLHGGSGISPDQISSAINLGIVKININTDLRLQFKKSLVRTMTEIKSEKIYDYLNPVVSDLKTLIVQKLNQFTNHV
jgi:ketose-bisphosphate aldolase